jgi:carbon storage regulator CsrA
MLVLSRKVGEIVIITAPDGTQIVLMLVEVRGDICGIGIAAPTTYTIYREEVQQRISSNGK